MDNHGTRKFNLIQRNAVACWRARKDPHTRSLPSPRHRSASQDAVILPRKLAFPQNQGAKMHQRKTRKIFFYTLEGHPLQSRETASTHGGKTRRRRQVETIHKRGRTRAATRRRPPTFNITNGSFSTQFFLNLFFPGEISHTTTRRPTEPLPSPFFFLLLFPNQKGKNSARIPIFRRLFRKRGQKGKGRE